MNKYNNASIKLFKVPYQTCLMIGEDNGFAYFVYKYIWYYVYFV